MSDEKCFDVIIAGGAMAGATLALALNALSRGKLSIAVIEAFQVDHHAHPGFDDRAIALSHGTVALLEQWQLWDAMRPFATAITDIHVSDRSHAGMTEIHAQSLALDALGYVVELARVGALYAEKMAQCVNIAQYCPTSVSHISRSLDSVSVTLSDNSHLVGKLLVAADGTRSTCCEKLGIPQQELDFHQVAVIANVQTNQPHQGRAFERFTTSGPLALLPMDDNRLSLVWCVSALVAEQIMQMDDSCFLEQLQRDFGWRIGRFIQAGKRSCYPLALRYRHNIVSHRFAMIGNAAQTLHPIAGQGFNLAIRDVASLAEEIIKSDQIGDYSSLSRFQQRRTADRLATIQLTSTLVHLFSNDWMSFRIGRNLGLMAMDSFSFLSIPLLQRTLGVVNR
ncbi:MULTISPECIES: 2-octaprenyl-6-methoxyphenyl hydroxylase [Vibrio]|uniref:2-octaprenyl-6-methoxyphenyl hydroxylase n=1 Tax=Vibrio TaxID=662 RepID=UPI000C1628E9|nr:2-octaprenyl-6-methoxyphenyl hydroxylase [Vibrio fujianensis]NAW69064.1 2-octaprenyl-6-methoxyphenyl hydroxylase [Vibrio sp. V28_P6S34P95]NAX04319.1 2-octaprenyl-6-methoxyphenyl hydroxylase [Vibrio sp. V30_P3S12P165]NAX35724.1 2-octaprenyl-6-methoxyphenyl hydroxylase [Vibrio sp. V29_P1S30P107]NAX36149.1 2-octaprenyl-6-methoxyphenyl hydroxylase [Vibrio sp. V27_P1S3P104]NAX39268.1 2-octaprenyl-6-methoxyphenyl hydroxylase [Vibrio sp. V26_P1S5P106]NNN45823.1 2-octaprenyl-6-methoxyphenyl hydrox